MHSAKCDVVIPGEEQLSSIPYRGFVAFRESAVNIHSLFKLDWCGCQTFSLSSSPLPGSTISFFLSFFSVYFCGALSGPHLWWPCDQFFKFVM